MRLQQRERSWIERRRCLGGKRRRRRLSLASRQRQQARGLTRQVEFLPDRLRADETIVVDKQVHDRSAAGVAGHLGRTPPDRHHIEARQREQPRPVGMGQRFQRGAGQAKMMRQHPVGPEPRQMYDAGASPDAGHFAFADEGRQLLRLLAISQQRRRRFRPTADGRDHAPISATPRPTCAGAPGAICRSAASSSRVL